MESFVRARKSRGEISTMVSGKAPPLFNFCYLGSEDSEQEKLLCDGIRINDHKVVRLGGCERPFRKIINAAFAQREP
jgi:hypothetical protein